MHKLTSTGYKHNCKLHNRYYKNIWEPVRIGEIKYTEKKNGSRLARGKFQINLEKQYKGNKFHGKELW